MGRTFQDGRIGRIGGVDGPDSNVFSNIDQRNYIADEPQQTRLTAIDFQREQRCNMILCNCP